MKSKIQLRPLREDEIPDFIKRNQVAFRKAVQEEFDFHQDVISPDEILDCLKAPQAQAFQLIHEGQIIGACNVVIDEKTQHNEVDTLFIDPSFHGQGLGTLAWEAIEKQFPETKVWELVTPYFEKRNIHFYVNKLGFHITEFFNPLHQPKEDHHEPDGPDFPGSDYFFKFEKIMTEESHNL